MRSQADPRGSVWRRWDPHIHTPGTAMNDQFGANSWDEYLCRIEQSEPKIEALGITDYCSLDQYEAVLAHHQAGRLSEVGLIFPNVELRLPTATNHDHPVNIHLLISPEDPDHVKEARRFLRTLKFQSGGETYACERADLVKLGKAHDPTIVDDIVALSTGTNLFKVPLEVLKQSFAESAWARQNILIAVAAGSTDGTSGVRESNGSLEAVRVEIERLSKVIFASSPAQRSFWVGEGVLGIDELVKKYDGPKPCLHGSDAHTLDAVGRPDQNRFTWIKGDATFESLRQACLEPMGRAIVADVPPEGALPYRVIDRIVVSKAEWLTTPELELSSGLVAVIGARGSGKTALADLIAAGAGAARADETDQTFLQRARRHIAGTSVELSWVDGTKSTADLPPQPAGDEEPRVQYLSQQFVERLCSAEGITDELLAEIERVIFESHPYEDRLGASSFRELLNLRAGHGRGLRQYAKAEIESLSEQVEAERTAAASLTALKKDRDRVMATLVEDRKARSGLVVVGGEDRSKRLEEVNGALAARQAQVDALRRRERALSGLNDALGDLVLRRLPAVRAELERSHPDAGLTVDEWNDFTLTFVGDPAKTVADRLAAVGASIVGLAGPEVEKPVKPASELPPFIPDGAELSQQPLVLLRAEAWRVAHLIGLDETKQKQLQALNEKIAKSEAVLETLERSISSAEGAGARIQALVLRRKEAYASLFDGFASEQRELEEMYSPLREILDAEMGALGKLTFIVRRVVDVESWASWGESLLDLRSGTFRGRGELLRIARAKLLPAWEVGASVDVADAMAVFRSEHDRDILGQAKASRSDVEAYRKWAEAVSRWLNSTEHISVKYGVQYEGVDIEQLSPGTRGIVLLLLYLAVDRSDDRPLVIDQPEENLDPKSIFVELVGRFMQTRRRRQIIIVTHNANLVVNTDADQVIVASAGPHRLGKLPEMNYTSGGLENPEIRAQVCEILEGGRPAFEERARRLRIRLS